MIPKRPKLQLVRPGDLLHEPSASDEGVFATSCSGCFASSFSVRRTVTLQLPSFFSLVRCSWFLCFLRLFLLQCKGSGSIHPLRPSSPRPALSLRLFCSAQSPIRPCQTILSIIFLVIVAAKSCREIESLGSLPQLSTPARNFLGPFCCYCELNEPRESCSSLPFLFPCWNVRLLPWTGQLGKVSLSGHPYGQTFIFSCKCECDCMKCLLQNAL